MYRLKIGPYRDVERVNYRKTLFWKIKQIVKHKKQMNEANSPEGCRQYKLILGNTDGPELTKWPLTKAVMLYLTVHKPTHFINVIDH